MKITEKQFNDIANQFAGGIDENKILLVKNRHVTINERGVFLEASGKQLLEMSNIKITD